ncbi:MAG: LysR family transcriptional regulator [Myxococcota bacterium]
MENWTDVRMAFLIGKLGTISAAAESAGVHRATVVRRVEALEEYLGGKLFQRHRKGYTPTELGMELIRIAEDSDASFRGLIAKAKNVKGLSGDFIVSCPEVVDDYMFGAVEALKAANHRISFHLRESNEVPKLEHGDAHVAITLGQKPEHPDYVVQKLTEMPVGLFQHVSIAGALEATNEDAPFSELTCPFIRSDVPYHGNAVEDWLETHVPCDQFVLTVTTTRRANEAIIAGLGAGFMPVHVASRFEMLKEATPRRDEWVVPVWMVTHIDLHRTPKVRAFVDAIKAARDRKHASELPDEARRGERYLSSVRGAKATSHA